MNANTLNTPAVRVTPTSFFPVSNPTHAFWTHSSPDANPLAREGSTDALPKEIDIAIIGSGITGVSVAYHLARLTKDKPSSKPLKVAIFEARDFCSGATGRNGGHLTAKGPLEFTPDVEQFGLADAIRQAQIEEYTVSEIKKIIDEHDLAKKIDFQAPGRVTIPKTDEEYELFEASIKGAREAGMDVRKIELLGREEMQKRYGIAERGLWQPGTNLWPLKLVTELYKITQNLTPNVTIKLYTRTPVHSVARSVDAGRWVLSTPRGAVTATRVVHATNAYVPYLVPHLSERIVPTRSQLIALCENKDRPIPSAAWVVNGETDYWFPRPAAPGEPRTVIAGGCRRHAGPPYASGTVDDGEVNAKVGKALRILLPENLPGRFDEDEVKPDMEWTGIMGYSSTGSPLVGPLPDDLGVPIAGQYICAAYQGHGMPRAYACAEVVARILAGDIDGTGKWELPEWLPRCYLTESPEDSTRRELSTK